MPITFFKNTSWQNHEKYHLYLDSFVSMETKKYGTKIANRVRYYLLLHGCIFVYRFVRCHDLPKIKLPANSGTEFCLWWKSWSVCLACLLTVVTCPCDYKLTWTCPLNNSNSPTTLQGIQTCFYLQTLKPHMHTKSIYNLKNIICLCT